MKKKAAKVRLKDKEVEELVRETTHIPDRDQMQDKGTRIFPPPSQMRAYTQWGGDEESTEGSRTSRSIDVDTVEEFKRTEQNLQEPDNRVLRSEEQEAVPPAGEDDVTPKTEGELREEADVLGIAGRQTMTRQQLAVAVKAATETMI